MRNKTSKSNYQWIKFDISDCYEDYQSKGSHFSLTSKEYRKIIKTFFNIYFYEVFFLNYPIYFPFGGKIRKNKVSESVKISKLKAQNNQIISLKNNVGLLWYDRPFKKFDEFVFKKMVGKTGSINKIQNEWLNENDPSALPTINELKNNGLKFCRE